MLNPAVCVCVCVVTQEAEVARDTGGPEQNRGEAVSHSDKLKSLRSFPVERVLLHVQCLKDF